MAKHLRITGLVQGVGYRAWFEAQAHRLQLSGWVRNRADGSVEALVAGNANSLGQLIKEARRGPASAQVKEVQVSDSNEPAGAGFRVLPTALE